MERKYIKTFEQYISEEGDTADAPEEVTGAEGEEETPDKDPDKEEKKEPDYSDVDPTPTKIMTALNKAGFEITEEDIVKWDGTDGEDSDGDLLVKIDGDDKYFTVDNGLLYYQLEAERVMLGKLNSTEDIVIAIKDYFDVKDEDEKKEDDKEKEAEGDGGDEGGGNAPTMDGEEDELEL